MYDHSYARTMARVGTKNNALIIVRGCPGYGKTTFAELMTRQLQSVKTPILHIEVDQYFSRYGEYYFDRDNLGQAHGWCLSTSEITLSCGLTTIVSNTFTTWKEIVPYVDYAVKFGHPIWVYTMDKEYGSIHNVPHDTLVAMKERMVNHDTIVKLIEDF